MGEFIDFVLRNRCARVEVMTTSSALSMPGIAGCSMFVLFSAATDDIGTAYGVCCSAVAPHGEKMVYDHLRVVRYVSQCEYAADHERHAFEIFFKAEKCFAELERRLGNVTVELVNGSGIPITGATREELHRRKGEHGATPPWGYP